MKVRKYEWFNLSKVKKIAEEFLAKHPGMFSTDFEANKKTLDQIAIIRNRALRNQIAGAITAMAGEFASEADIPKDHESSEQDSTKTEALTQPQ